MKNQPKITVRLATQIDFADIVCFLSLPEIDQSFVSPLSCRNIGIRERVYNIIPCGFWLIGIHAKRVIGCRGCKGLVDKTNKIVEFSATVVAPSFRNIGLGKELVRLSMKIALTRYDPYILRINSWSTNKVMERIALDAGFVKCRIFDDPAKRPQGIQTVEYELNCKNVNR